MRDEFLVVGVVCFSSSLSWLILWICFCQRKGLGSGFWLRWHLPQQCRPGDHDHVCQKGFVLQKTSRKYLHCPFRYPKAIWNEIKNRNSQVDSYNMWGVRKIPWRRETLPTPVFWPRQFLGVYSPWGRKESDKIGWLNNNSNEVSPFVKQRNQQYLHDCAHVQVLIRVQLFAALWPVAPKILYPWNFSGKNTEMDCHFHLQEVFPTQGLNPGLLHFTIYIGWQVLFCWTIWETTHYITGLF